MSADVTHSHRAIATARSRLAKDRENVKNVIIDKIEACSLTHQPGRVGVPSEPNPHSSASM